MAKITSKPAKKSVSKGKVVVKATKPKAAALQSRTAAKSKVVKPVKKLVAKAAKKPVAKVQKKPAKPVPAKKTVKATKTAKPKPVAKKPLAAQKSAKHATKPAPKTKQFASKVAKKPVQKKPVVVTKPIASVKKPAPITKPSKPAAVKSAPAKPVPVKAAPVKQTEPSTPVTKPSPSKITTNINAVKSAAKQKPVVAAFTASDNGIKKEGGRYLLPVNTIIDLPAGYKPSADEEYMNPAQLAYFRNKLQKWRDDLVEESKQTIDNLREEVRDVGDEAERATRETENSLELRTRDRYRKLIAKIDKAFKRIEDGRYGFCEETDEDIGIDRLDARPIATLCLDAQERWEHRQKQMGD